MKRKHIKEPVIRCNRCGGKGWTEGSLIRNPGGRNAPPDAKVKWIRCPACGGRGIFK